MSQADAKIREKILKRLNSAPEEIVQHLIQHHRRNSPDLRMAIWLNPSQDPWKKGLDLMEVFENSPVEPSPEFRPIEFAPQEGWPRIRVIITSPGEMNLALEPQRSPFLERLLRSLAHGSARVVFPKSKKCGRFLLEALMGEAEG